MVTDADTIYMNPDSSHMFNGIESLISVDTDSFDTSNVTDMRYMFDSIDSLT